MIHLGPGCARIHYTLRRQQAKRFAQQRNLRYEDMSKEEREDLVAAAALVQMRGDTEQEADPIAELHEKEKKRLLTLTPLHLQVNKVPRDDERGFLDCICNIMYNLFVHLNECEKERKLHGDGIFKARVYRALTIMPHCAATARGNTERSGDILLRTALTGEIEL